MFAHPSILSGSAFRFKRSVAGCVNCLVGFVLLLCIASPAWSQEGDSVIEGRLLDTEVLWDAIVRHSAVSSGFGYDDIDSLVTLHAGEGVMEQVQAYMFLMDEFEKDFDLPSAVYAAEQVVGLAGAAEFLQFRLDAYASLSSYHCTLNNLELCRVNYDLGIALARKIGHTREMLAMQYALLERNYEEDPIEENLEKISVFINDNESVLQGDYYSYMLTRLFMEYYKLGHDSLIAPRLAGIEVSLPGLPEGGLKTEVSVRLKMLQGVLAYGEGYIDKARRYLTNSLDHVRNGESKWLEIFALLNLAKFEIDEDQYEVASELLDAAYYMAQDLNSLDQLIEISQHRSELFMKQGDLEQVLIYDGEKYAFEKQFEDRSAGFDLQNYYLRKEKIQLETQKRNQALALSVKEFEVRNLYLISYLLVSVLAILGFIVYFLYKKRRAIEDETKRIQLQAEEQRQLNEAKSRFFVNTSHELRTPISLILGPLSSLKSSIVLPPEQAPLLDLALDNTKSLVGLVNDILDLSKLTSGQMLLSPSRVFVHSFFQSEVEKWSIVAREKGVAFDFQCVPKGAFEFDLDSTKFGQVLSNLISNALKHTPRGGAVSVQLNVNPYELVLVVTDTGVGISAVDLPNIFGRYYQGRQDGDLEAGGTGIGLAICYEIVQLFKGEISVESTLSKGAAFTVSIPIERFENLAKAVPEVVSLPDFELSEAGIDLPIVEKKISILVAEDNRGIRAFLGKIISPHYEVKLCSNGQEAIEEMQAHPTRYSLLLTDLMMPGMDGFQLIDQVKNSEQLFAIPIIVLTARSLEQDRHKLLRLGVDQYLAKPFVESELLASIDSLIGNLELRKAEAFIAALEGHPSLTNEDYKWLQEFEDFVLKSMCDAGLTIGRLAKHFSMSESTLLRKTKLLVGLTPKQYLQESRLQNARYQLTSKRIPVKELAQKVGYNDVRNFSRKFKERFGENPSDFLKA